MAEPLTAEDRRKWTAQAERAIAEPVMHLRLMPLAEAFAVQRWAVTCEALEAERDALRGAVEAVRAWAMKEALRTQYSERAKGRLEAAGEALAILAAARIEAELAGNGT